MSQRSGRAPAFLREFVGYKQDGEVKQYYELDHNRRDWTYYYEEDPHTKYVREVTAAGYDNRIRCDVCPKQGRSPVYIIESYNNLKYEADCGHSGCREHTPAPRTKVKSLIKEHFEQVHTQEELDQWAALHILTRGT